ncbi:Thiolase, N-terminal domain-containing protein [Xylaria sp. CBS 124048]|nr:Thiolase, N-terminal domain-containing protein [Xylaria sp. CBS 124048]
MSFSPPNGITESDQDLVPSTPPEVPSIPSTEDLASPIDPSASFQTEQNGDDRMSAMPVIRSSVTPPPSSQNTQANTAAGRRQDYANQPRSNSMLSPPATTMHLLNRDRRSTADYIPPSAAQIKDAAMDELRSMLQDCLAINAKLKSETAHHKLQYELLSIQAAEDANRASVEHEMTRREVDALRMAEHARQARRDLESSIDTTHIKYRELQRSYDALAKEHKELLRRFKSASRLVQQQAEEIYMLNDDREMLLTRIRENREHFHMLCSPGGAFHGALTPKTPSTSPQQRRSTPRQTPRSATRGARHENDTDAAPFAALIQALNQDNSAPTTPTSANRAPQRVFRQHRAAHSLSSLPATPLARSRGNPGLLPSIDLVPRTEPAQRFGSRVEPQTPTPRKRRKSRESTISVEDEDEASTRTMTLESVAAAAQSYMSQGAHHTRRREGEGVGEEVYESQATQAASEMLRRDPRESYEVASSVGSRDVSPTPADKSNKLQTKLYAPPSQKDALWCRRPSWLGDSTRSQKSLKMAAFPKGLKAILTKSPTDIIILSSLRTPICRSYKGSLKDAYPEELLSTLLRATLTSTPGLDPGVVSDVSVGVVLSELGGSKAARMALNHAGFPNTTALHTVNRACGSSLQAISAIAAQIAVGAIDAGIAAGMESMTRNYGSKAIPTDVWPALLSPGSPANVRDCVMPMGLTSENVASRYSISREDQDLFALSSHQRAAKARESGHFTSEIVPVATTILAEDGLSTPITVSQDDGIRPSVSLEKLSALKPAFHPSGTSTAGNSSQISDGAAATLLMRRDTAEHLGLTAHILGKFLGASLIGCSPDEMGIGPAFAVPRLLSRFGLQNHDIHRWEINEAFASQALYCIRQLGLENAYVDGKVNPDGGAIALGHPLGATGARMVSTLLHGLGREQGEVGVTTLCIGTGMGMAGLFVRE